MKILFALVFVFLKKFCLIDLKAGSDPKFVDTSHLVKQNNDNHLDFSEELRLIVDVAATNAVLVS